MSETNNTERTFKSVNGKSLDAKAEGELRFINAGRLQESGTTGVVAQGIYEGAKDVEGKFGVKPQYSIRQDDGTLVLIDGSGNLNSQMSKVETNSYVQISYLGKDAMTTGKYKGTLAHRWLVGVAE